MRVLITVTDSWSRARSTWLTSFNRSYMPPLDSCSNCHTGHPSPISCIGNCIGSTFRVEWDSRSDKCLHGLAPQYLTDYCVSVQISSTHLTLRSARHQERHLIVPRTRTRTIGPRGFFYDSPAFWNSIPDDLRDPELSSFRNKLKTFLFSQISKLFFFLNLVLLFSTSPTFHNLFF